MKCVYGIHVLYFVCIGFLFPFLLQNKYKEDGKKNLSQSIYSQLPETSDTQFAKTVSQTQSEVRQDRERCYFFDTGDILVRMRSCWAVTDYYGLYGSR